MEKLKSIIQHLSDFIECNVTMTGDAHFEISSVCQLRAYVEELEKEIAELEKVQNYNQAATEYKKPKNIKIESKVPQSNRVEHPSHYTWLKNKCGIEVIDITRHLNFNIGNVVKYVLRSGHKSEKGMSDKQKQIEDLQKAVFYINDEIERLRK